MICLGNICRSPLADGILKNMAEKRGLGWEIDSAGTSGWHSNEPPHPLSISVAASHGIDISTQRSRRLQPYDLAEFDYLLCMDAQNYQDTIRLAQTDEERAKVHLIRNFVKPNYNMQVPDPYTQGRNGYEEVFNMLTEACEKFIDSVILI
jgi:protein-tyrosine phosphatase